MNAHDGGGAVPHSMGTNASCRALAVAVSQCVVSMALKSEFQFHQKLSLPVATAVAAVSGFWPNTAEAMPHCSAAASFADELCAAAAVATARTKSMDRRETV